MRWFRNAFVHRRPYFETPLDEKDLQHISDICLRASVRVIKIIEVPRFASFDESSVKLVHVLRHPLRVLNSWLAYNWIHQEASVEVANKLCKGTMELYEARGNMMMTIFTESGVNATALYEFAAPRESLSTAQQWQMLVKEKVDMHSGSKYEGPRALRLVGVDVETILRSCAEVIALLPPKEQEVKIQSDSFPLSRSGTAS
jgi:hypothetical protein